uniref:Uncharacterized protein n=1 Tax=Chelydra serpentina TaxID=8475 RepID=A0A8C3SL33_CHESE
MPSCASNAPLPCTLAKPDIPRPGVVARACNPSCLGGCGWWITQEHYNLGENPRCGGQYIKKGSVMEMLEAQNETLLTRSNCKSLSNKRGHKLFQDGNS